DNDFAAYNIDDYLRSYHAMKRLRNVVHITSKKPDWTFLSKLPGVYKTLRLFVRFDRWMIEARIRSTRSVSTARVLTPVSLHTHSGSQNSRCGSWDQPGSGRRPARATPSCSPPRPGAPARCPPRSAPVDQSLLPPCTAAHHRDTTPRHCPACHRG